MSIATLALAFPIHQSRSRKLNVERVSISDTYLFVYILSYIYLFLCLLYLLLIQTALVSNAENLFFSLCH